MALYHTYRPTTWDDVAYQSHVIDTLKNQLISGKVAHAYLFSGPRGVGKTTTARILAKAVNLGEKEGTADFDNTSEAAKEIDESRSIDIIEIDAASHTGVDNVREHIIDNARFHPTKLKKKVFIIDEVHMLSTSAFNALLKTLEEPPAHVMFILATTELHKIPDTIISRCQVFRFQRVPFDAMKEHLEGVLKKEKVTVDEDVLARIINKSDGCVRDAMSLLDQVLATGESHITKDHVTMLLPTSDVSTTLAFLTAVVGGNGQDALSILSQAAEEGSRMDQFATDVLELLRLLIIFKATSHFRNTGIDLSDTAKESLSTLASQISESELVQLTDLFLKRKTDIKSSPISQMPLEMVAIEWRSRHEQPTVHATIAPPRASVEQLPVTKAHTSPPPQEKTHVAPIEAPPQDHTPEPLKTSDEATAEVPQAPVPSQGGAEIDEQLVRKHWNAWISAVEVDFPTLVFILKMTSIKKIEANTIVLTVEYAFHRDKLLDKKVKRALEIAYSNFLGSQIEIDVIIEKPDGTSPSDVETTNELTDLTAAFGGQVVG